MARAINKLIKDVKNDITKMDDLLNYLRVYKKYSQMESLKFIRREFNLSIPEADNIILHSSTWIDHKEETINLRNEFERVLKNEPFKD